MFELRITAPTAEALREELRSALHALVVPAAEPTAFAPQPSLPVDAPPPSVDAPPPSVDAPQAPETKRRGRPPKAAAPPEPDRFPPFALVLNAAPASAPNAAPASAPNAAPASVPEATYDQARAALQKHGEQHGREAVLSVLASVGLPRLPGATPEQYGRVVAACAEPLL